jgi:hypothetical protein
MGSLALHMMLIFMASGLEVNLKDFSEDFAGEQVKSEAFLSADRNQVIVADQEHANSLDSLSDIAKTPQPGNETAMMEWNTGAPVPPPVDSFPGCRCDWNEPGWTCEGSAISPRVMAGKKCCCCGIHCKMGRRCTDDECWAIGVDQGDEVREEERRWKEMMKNADFALNGDLPVKVAELERGRCTNTAIENACRKYQMTPVCDHNAYVNMKRCYSIGLKGTKYHNRHISHWASHRQYMGFPEEIERKIHGMCFMGNNGNWALAPIRNSHTWTNHNGAYSSSHVPYPNKVANMHVNDIDQCKPVDKGGWGCWRTFCVPKDPNWQDFR